MVILYFFAALAGIVLFAVIVNRLTGTRASYLEALQLAPGERELWRDSGADFGLRPRTGSALALSFPRLRRHSVLWTDRRLVIANRVLGSDKHLITHQVVFEAAPPADADTRAAASEFAGGFYGRGFSTLFVRAPRFTRVNDKECVCLVPSEASGAALNVLEAYLFSDRLTELQAQLDKG